ncbi:MAG: hypothetical protein N2578_01055 [Bdellovibrionaceae bacterium]|nr:hypothetical protein [Pseudobdellovibrionaceae bacterium]
MLKLLASLYVIAVLALSAVARAASSSFESVTYNPEFSMITLTGKYHSACLPQFNVKAQPVSKNVYSVQVIEAPNWCIGLYVQRSFSFGFDVRVLGLPEGEQHILLFKGEKKDFAVPVQVETSLQQDSIAFKNVKGALFVRSDGTFGLHLPNKKVARLETLPGFDLSSHLGKTVVLSVFEVNHEVSPGLDPVELASAGATSRNAKQFEDSEHVYLVLGITEVIDR